MKRKTMKIGMVAFAILLATTLVSAALVGYLSNTVETTVTVSSPMEQWNSYDGTTWTKGDLSFPNVLGGETVTVYVKTKNNANAPIDGDGENIITNPSGVTNADFSLVQARTSSNGATYTSWYPLTGTPVNSNTVDFAYGPLPSPMTWQAGQVDITEIQVTFKGNAYGTYTFTSQIVP